MKQAMAICMSALLLAVSVMPLSALAADELPAAPSSSKIAAEHLAEQFAGRMMLVGARQYAEGRLDSALDSDAASARLLPPGSPARVAFLEEVVRRTHRIAGTHVRPLIPAVVAAFNANMTPAQISASARLFDTRTGQRILDRVVSELILSQDDGVSEMTDAEARSLTRIADAPAIVAFEKSGALQALEKAFDAVPEQDDEVASIFEGEIDALLHRMLAALKTPGGATVTTPVRPVL